MMQFYTASIEGLDHKFKYYTSRPKAERAIREFCIDNGHKCREVNRFKYRIGEYPYEYASIEILIAE